MCKFNPENKGRRIDPCMKILIRNLNNLLDDKFKIVSCCCGHKKYPQSIVVISKEYCDIANKRLEQENINDYIDRV